MTYKEENKLPVMRKITKSDQDYPAKLREQERMPGVLYVVGDLPDPFKKSVSIIGARGCSQYGRTEALRFARVFAENNVQVISGMALGIDSWAHIGALEAGGRTFAVLGSGADVCYPASHEALYGHIAGGGGGIISEFEPGAPPMRHHFPLRNRIISALADVVLVIEARRKSGSLITVSYALEQGKSVYAIPGRNGDALSEGCNRLVTEGAGLAWGPEVILQDLGLIKTGTVSGASADEGLPARLSGDAACLSLYEVLNKEEKDLDMLVSETALPVQQIAAGLMKLCMAGFAEELPGHFFVRS